MARHLMRIRCAILPFPGLSRSLTPSRLGRACSRLAQSSTAPYGLTFRPTSCALWYEPIEYVKETVAFKEYERQLEDEANQDAGYAQEVADLEQMEEEDDLPMP